MLITRLHLRNFRVYEQDLDLELPPGLVGIHGPNGSGKSTLLEAILFALWGKSRTSRELIRTAGVAADGVCAIEFEHEGHLYTVRRTVKGVNSSSAVEVTCDGAVMATATRDAQAYVESILGLDVDAFRASVFAEQNQLAAFSAQRPEERRRLVMALLGITPLDEARDAARRDARECSADHDRLRAMLPELEALEVEASDSDAAASAAEVAATEEVGAAAAARGRLEDAERELLAFDLLRQRHERVVVEGRAVRERLERARSQVAGLVETLAGLDDASARLKVLEEQSSGLDEDSRRLDLLVEAARAARAADASPAPDPPGDFDATASSDASKAAESVASELAAATAYEEAARESLRVALAAQQRAESISDNSTCPTCGQVLGESFDAVRAHHRREVDSTSALLEARGGRVVGLREEAARTRKLADKLRREEAAHSERVATFNAALRKAEEAHAERLGAWLAVGAGSDMTFSEGLRDTPNDTLNDTLSDTPGDRPGASLPSTSAVDAMVLSLRERIDVKRGAHAEALGLRGMFATRATSEAALDAARSEMDEAASLLDGLREQARALRYRPEDLESASGKRNSAAKVSQRSDENAHAAGLRAARLRERADGAATRLADAKAQHDKLGDLEKRSRHLARTAELLARFRDTVVASVGPRLATQAAALFGELTDNEYEGVQVDPDTFQLQILDGGQLYGLDRFSGSEVDLANLALRVAISEHVNFQSGGAVGLLVLDEVFGPLDDDRKTRMLLALERLRGRFRQILIVTHDTEIKEQLPSAVEVVKLPGRRATARLVDV